MTADDPTSAARLATAVGTSYWQSHERSDLVVAAAPTGATEVGRRSLARLLAVMVVGVGCAVLSDVVGLGLSLALLVSLLSVGYVIERAEAARRGDRPASEPPIRVSYADDRRATSLARFAVQTADEIRRTQTWQSSELDLHRARLDLHEEVRLVARRAEAVARARHALPVLATLPMTPETEPIRSQHALLERSLDSLHNRVAALVEYRAGLLAYEGQLRLLAQIEQAERVDLSEAVLGAADDEVASANLAELSGELREAREAVRSTLSTLARLSDPMSEIERS